MVVPQDPTSQLMVAVADRAAEAVVPNNRKPRDMFHGVENLATSFDTAAVLLDIPREGRTPVHMLATVIATDAVTNAVAMLFSRACYRRALAVLARRYERGTNPSAGEVAMMVGPYLPKLERIKEDVASVYIRMGWVSN